FASLLPPAANVPLFPYTTLFRSEALLTDFDEHDLPTTSCSAPSVVSTMLESSRVAEGDSVLEVGTGTGWTAGLLVQRLGPDAVRSEERRVGKRCRCRWRL